MTIRTARTYHSLTTILYCGITVSGISVFSICFWYFYLFLPQGSHKVLYVEGLTGNSSWLNSLSFIFIQVWQNIRGGNSKK